MATNRPRPVNYGRTLPCQTCGTVKPEMKACPKCNRPGDLIIPPPPPPPILNAAIDVGIIRKAARAIAERCFTNVYGERCQRLVLIDDEPKRDWGGYCFESFEKNVGNELAKVLWEHIANPSGHSREV